MDVGRVGTVEEVSKRKRILWQLYHKGRSSYGNGTKTKDQLYCTSFIIETSAKPSQNRPSTMNKQSNFTGRGRGKVGRSENGLGTV